METPKTVYANVDRIKELAKARKEKLYEVSINCGFKRQYLHQISHNKRMSYEYLLMLADYFKVDPSSLILERPKSADPEIERQMEQLIIEVNKMTEVIESLNKQLKDKDKIIHLQDLQIEVLSDKEREPEQKKKKAG